MTLLKRLRHRRPAAVILLIAALLGGQSVAAAHLHADDLADASCAVCTLAKAETAACDSHAQTLMMPAASALPVRASAGGHRCAEPGAFYARGPPRA